MSLEPTETPLAEPPIRRAGRFGLASVRLRLGAERFELSVWDWEPMSLLCVPVAWGLLWALSEPLRFLVACCIGIGLLAVQARRVVTVTQTGSFAEHRLFGICWRRLNLGIRPRFQSGLVWNWCELAVVPADERLRKLRHDEDRFVLADWDDRNEQATRDADRVAALANAETVRLHEGLPERT